MSWFYKEILRPYFFQENSEVIHRRIMHLLAFASEHHAVRQLLNLIHRPFQHPSLVREVFGITFPNPIGLAAGFDKNAEAVPVWERFGFGFVEIGSVTAHAQPGNPEPRLFRLVEDEAIINRMGFNNVGAKEMAVKLKKNEQEHLRPLIPLGINLGKSKITPLEKASEDYRTSFQLLKDHGDYFVVNVSSPNTPNLRQLQDKGLLKDLLGVLQEMNKGTKPLLVKIAPDLGWTQIDDVLELAMEYRLSGVIATNTTLSREGLQSPYRGQAGGLSGRPLRQRSTEVIRHVWARTRGQLPIIGVGGIFDSEDVIEKILAGSSLVQVYTGWIYEGPGMVNRTLRSLVRQMEQRGVRNIRELTGAGTMK